MLRDKSTQLSFYGSHIYERIIPKDRFDEAVGFPFVNELCRDAYTPDFGRPAYEPEMMFKILFLQFLYDASERRIKEDVNLQLVFKWFVGLTMDEAPPDSSSLARFRDRLGEERFCPHLQSDTAHASMDSRSELITRLETTKE